MAQAKSAAVVPSLPKTFTVAEWQSNVELQAQLRDLLNTPIMQMAEATLKNTAMPRTPASINPMANVSAEAMDKSLAYAFIDRAGFVRYHDRLHALARPKTENPKSHEQWGELLKEDE